MPFKRFYASRAEALRHLVGRGRNVTCTVTSQNLYLASREEFSVITGQIKVPLEASESTFTSILKGFCKYLILTHGSDTPFICVVTFNLRKLSTMRSIIIMNWFHFASVLKSRTSPPSYSVYYGTSYGPGGVEEGEIVEGTAASASFRGAAGTSTYELQSLDDYSRLPTRFDPLAVAASVQPYFEDLGSDVEIDTVLSAVYLARKIVKGRAEDPAMEEVYYLDDHRACPDVVTMGVDQE